MNATQTEATEEKKTKDRVEANTDQDRIRREAKKTIEKKESEREAKAVMGEIIEEKIAKKLVFGESAQVVTKSEPATSKFSRYVKAF